MADSSNIFYDPVRRAFFGDAALYASTDYVLTVGDNTSFYDRAIDIEDEQLNMDDLEFFELASSVLQLQTTDVYFERALIRHLKGATIESTNYTNNIRYIYMDAGGYTAPVASDLGKFVVGGTSGDEGVLLDFFTDEDGTTEVWVVRVNYAGAPTPTGAEFDTGEALSITGGTGAGSFTAASSSGENQNTAVRSIGTVASGDPYMYRDDQLTKIETFWGSGNSDAGGSVAGLFHIEVLIEAKRHGSWIQNGLGIVYNRTYGETPSHARFDLKPGGVQTLSLSTSNDDNITLTAGQAEDLQDGTTANISFNFGGSPYAADVDDDDVDETYEFQGNHDNRSDSDAFHVAQWLVSTGQVAVTVDGVPGEAYISADPSYIERPAAPLISSAGEYAQGGYAINAVGSAWKARDITNALFTPPPTRPIGWTDGLRVTGGADRISSYVESAPGSKVPDRSFFTLSTVAGDNESGDGTVVFDATIPKDFPDDGELHLWQQSTLTSVVFPYTSWSGDTVTLAGTLDQAYDDGSWTAEFWYFDRAATGNNFTLSRQHVIDRNVFLGLRNSSPGSTNKIKRGGISGVFDAASGFAVPASRIPETLAT